MVSISLSYSGALSDNNMIDMYDAARGLSGFHRSIALTAHLVINGEIITQAPSLKGAQIITSTPEQGSWKVTATVLAGIWAVTTASKDTVPGHLLFSAYDYVVNSAMGFHVDFSKSIGQSYEEHVHKKKITPEKMDSLIEKIEPSLVDIHRPIVASKTASQADMKGWSEFQPPLPIGPHMTYLTHEFLAKTINEKDETLLEGVISSFNINTCKGRIFVFEEQRPIPFELSSDARRVENMMAITNSLRANAAGRSQSGGAIRLTAHRLLSPGGRLKGMIVQSVQASE